MMMTVLLSVFAHGMIAAPAASWYARRTDNMKEDTAAGEHVMVTEMPVRFPQLG